MKSLMRKTGSFLMVLVFLALIAGAFIYFRDTDGPRITIPEGLKYVSDKALTAQFQDNSGLRHVVVEVSQNGVTKELFVKNFDVGVAQSTEEFSLQGAQLRDGPVALRIRATDRSIYRFGAGNTNEVVVNLTYDGTPPRVNVLSTAHNINQGGSGLIVYTANEEIQKSGIRAGDIFFPGYRLADGNYACLFAFPHDMPSSDFAPRLVAVDLAGNEGRGGFYYHFNARNFRRDRINISDNFLNTKMVQYEQQFPEAKTPLDVFLAVNRNMRVKNRRQLQEIGRRTASDPLWDGAFIRMSGATMAQFGDHRSYYYQGKKIDEQTHLGIDLASTQHAAVPAANDGVVVLADFFGIYGNCVIIDHGLGLQTIYSHLSQIEVAEGDSIKQGDTVGRTGATGMAGGDHLHFGVAVSGIPVNPIEWWDGSWIRNNITSKLKRAR